MSTLLEFKEYMDKIDHKALTFNAMIQRDMMLYGQAYFRVSENGDRKIVDPNKVLITERCMDRKMEKKNYIINFRIPDVYSDYNYIKWQTSNW